MWSWAGLDYSNEYLVVKRDRDGWGKADDLEDGLRTRGRSA
jgi:hypothetical protein